MSLPHAVIIAGGQGERLSGVRKGALRIGGQRLVDRVVLALGSMAAPLMLSTGPSGSCAHSGALPVPDLASSVGGPLAGIAAAVASLRQRGIAEGLIVSVAVDTPFLPADFVARMQHELGQADAAYAAWGDQFYPPNAIWRIEALQRLPEQVCDASPPRSLKALHATLGSRRVDWADRYTADPFANLNTLADLLALGARVMHTAGK